MKIYVSNLNFDIESEALKNFFTVYGEVSSAKIVTDKETNRSRGFGFIEMPDELASKKAIAALNGSVIDGRSIKVMEAKGWEGQPAFHASDDTNYNNSNSYNENRY